MARLIITDIIELGIDADHSGTDWQVSKNDTFTDLILDIEKDPINLTLLRTELRDPSTGLLYDGYDGAYARARVWYGDYHSRWFELPACYENGNQNNDGIDDYIPPRPHSWLPHYLPHKL